MRHLKELHLAGFMLTIERYGASVTELRAANMMDIEAATGNFKHAGRTERIPLQRDNFRAVLEMLRTVGGMPLLSLRTNL